jgi:hypothetical protein
MTGRNDGFERGRRRAVRKLERRLAKLDRRLARVRLTLIEAVDEMAILEGRLAAVWGDGELEDEESDTSEDDRAWPHDDTLARGAAAHDESRAEPVMVVLPGVEPEPQSADGAGKQALPEPVRKPASEAGTASSFDPAPALTHETPWEHGVRELAERRASEYAAVTPEAMERLLAGALPAPSPSSAWPVIDPDRTW